MRSNHCPPTFLAILLSGVLLLTGEAAARHWVWFADKGPNIVTGLFDDAPVYPRYIAEVTQVAEVHQITRWFNGVSVVADEGQIERLRRFPFVVAVTPVGTWRRGAEPESELLPSDLRQRPARSGALDYGLSFNQMHLVRADSLHVLGLTGQGIRIAVFDDGFNYLDHPAFNLVRLNIIAKYDFIDQDTTIAFDPSYADHGTEVLSCLAAYAPGDLIGPAYDAEFLLARTEYGSPTVERPWEEDNWVAAAEWAHENSARIISTSIGYNWFQVLGTTNQVDLDSSYTLDQMDGKTSLITRAAQKAAARGIVVVSAAGNERGASPSYPSNWYWHGKLLMPSDGDSVIAVGAVYANGLPTSFTSAGPTADGRIKPDISALGSLVGIVTPSGYTSSSGTSYATPVVAGVVAQLLQAHLDWDPIAVRTALRLSASHALSPDTLTGWGVVNGLRAVAADSAILGRIVIDQTGQPNVGAIVRIFDSLDQQITYSSASDDGWFRFEHLPPGTYAIKGYWNYGPLGADTTLALPTLPREVRLRLRIPDSVNDRPRPVLWWVSQPIPNPANPVTTIHFHLLDRAAASSVQMTIYTAAGQAVRQMVVPTDWSGSVSWDGRDAQGREVATGVYLARLTLGTASVIRRIVVLR